VALVRAGVAAPAADLHVLALTQRGHGGSDKPASGYAPADFAADIAARLREIDVPTQIVRGCHDVFCRPPSSKRCCS
jgi:pimeloyl-ACP methyl ester carboxylesterase